MHDALFEHVAALLERHCNSGARLTVGLSGGLDSVVLLSLLHRLRNRFDFQLAAHHVNHQISPNAQSWASFCENLCAALAVPFSQTIVNVPRDTGKGLEAAARALRHEAFLTLDVDFILLGHHQDDQAETLLLRLLRGAGVKGLAAMAECSPIGNRTRVASAPRILRPLLHQPRSSLASFAHAEGLQWIDDESNTDIHYTRNYLRVELLPRINVRFPTYRSILDRAATQFAEAEQLLAVLAAIDAKDAINDGRITVQALTALDEPRAKNLLRYFLAQHHLKMPDHARLHEILRQISTVRHNAEVCIAHDGIELRVFRDWLYVVHSHSSPSSDFQLQWQGELHWRIPALHGAMVFEETPGCGIAKDALVGNNEVSVRLRQGGETLRLGENRPRQTLKNLLQTAGIPPWERERLPLLYIGDELAYVPGIGVDVAFKATTSGKGITLAWMSENTGHFSAPVR
ncbi:MAG: tRNA lysidine(34) synthetase TilS [Pseudomonadota bacterium]